MRKFGPFGVSPALAALFGVIALLAVAAAAQEVQVPKKPLRLLQETPIRLPSSMTALAGAPQCDNNGGLYFRASRNGASSPQGTPVVEFSSTGFLSRTFSLSSVPGYDLSTTASVSDFVVTGAGQVYFLATKDSVNGPDPELDVIRFSSGARYLSTLTLSHFFLPRRVAVLTGGSFFLLALDRDSYLSLQSRKFVPASFVYPVGLFFGVKGKLLREIALPDTTHSPALVAASETVNSTDGRPANDDPPFVTTAYDGSIYVTRHVRGRLAVYVITDSGATVYSVTVDPPFPHAVVAGIAPDGPRKLVIEFVRPAAGAAIDDSQAVFSVIDAESGIRLTDYQASPESTGILGCPTPVGFELLSRQPGGKLAIRFVSGKQPVTPTKDSSIPTP
jgi:hypothetical protein